jgi:hypothetical protein
VKLHTPHLGLFFFLPNKNLLYKPVQNPVLKHVDCEHSKPDDRRYRPEKILVIFSFAPSFLAKWRKMCAKYYTAQVIIGED